MKPGLLILLCSVFFLNQGFSQGIFDIDSVPNAYHRISSYIGYLEDPDGTLTLDEVRHEFQDQFKPFKGNRSFDHNSVYWGKITFKSNISESRDWIFYAGSNNHMDVFIPQEIGYESQKAGFFDPANTKKGSTGLESSGIKINLNPGEIKTLYIRAYNVNHYPVKFNVHLISPETWAEYVSKEDRNLVQGFFQGILWIMILYNIFLFFINRDKTYLYYTAYMIGLSIYFLNIHGFLTDSDLSIFKNSPKMAWYISIAVNISAIFYVQFIRSFLNLEQLLPKWDKISQAFVWGFVALVLFKLIVLITSFNIPVINVVMQTILLVGSLFSLILVIYLFRTGDKVARFFIAGTFFLVVSMLISALSYINMGGFSFNYFNYLQGGVVIEIILFSLGLGYRMRVSEEEKLTAQIELINQLTENERIQKRATTELEQKVLERTAEILDKNAELEKQNEEIINQRNKIQSQRDKLKTINEDLEQLNEEKNHLMSIVAHDLRNPLGSAMSVTDLMHEDKEELTEDQQEYLGLLKRTLKRMNEMIGKILDIRKSEDRNLKVNLEEINVASLIQQVANSFKNQCSKKELNLHLKTRRLTAEIDRDYFIQILENLVSNAIKFSPQGKNIYIHLDSSEDIIKICVQDEGPGLTSEDKKKLFGKFQRLSAQPTGGESSIGIGLSIVKKYTEAMGGKVYCESAPGQGARFILEFDAVKESVSSR